MDERSVRNSVPIWEKYSLTIKEASQYFNIGEKKLRMIADNHVELVLNNGSKVLIKRGKFEEFINRTESI